MTDVELPDGQRFEHHVWRSPAPASGIVVVADREGQPHVLLLWRHRFTTDTWGWEIPAGRVDEGETPIEAAVRECEEESGWRPSGVTPLGAYHPNNGQSDLTFHLFAATGAEHLGEPTDPNEADRVEWVPVAHIPGLIRRGEVLDGLTLTGLLRAFMDLPGDAEHSP
jgi:8-oxo-dGTP pyrophosphatase MutT (NUDIX family)